MIGDVVECWASPSFTRHRCLAGSGLALCGVRAVFLSNPWPHHAARAKDCPVCLVRASRELSHRE